MKLLIIYYSQSGQLGEILRSFIDPIEGAAVEWVAIRPKKDFPFPWPDQVFYDTMPESVLETPVELEEFQLRHSSYDLIVFGYQPWFLSPSIPATSLLKNESFRAVLANTPVITVIGSRNMWLSAQERVKQMIREAGGRLVGNIPRIDRTTNLISAITIVHWMLTGKKNRKFGVLPLPGVSDADIRGMRMYGSLLNAALKQQKLGSFQDEVVRAGAITIRPGLMFVDERAKQIFSIWANLIKRKEMAGQNRSFWVRVFKYYLLIALFLVSPILLICYNIFVRPFSRTAIRLKKEYYSSTELCYK